jgi:hypothetical protein
MGWWIIERWRCYWYGHRDLSRTQSCVVMLADGRVQMLHVCPVCGSLV